MRIVFLPPYSPELNPAEHIWKTLREGWFGNTVFKDMRAVERTLCNGLRDLESDQERTRRFAGFGWITSISLNAVWHQGDFDAVQTAIDYLSQKAKAKQAFTDDEKEFLVELFEAMWWGGKGMRMWEAATLVNHYVHGDGKALQVNPEVYRSSAIVKDTMTAMRSCIRQEFTRKKNKISTGLLRSYDATFLKSEFYKPLARYHGRSGETQGYLDQGYLKAEDQNQRLKKADHRFALQAHWSISNGRISVKWRVDSIYDFEPFEKKDYYTDLPLGKGRILKLPDGLSQYMTVIGIAKEFKYSAEWYDSETF